MARRNRTAQLGQGPALERVSATPTQSLSLMDRWGLLPQRTKYLIYGGVGLIVFVAFFRRRIVSTVGNLVTANTVRTVMPGAPLAKVVQYLPYIVEALEQAQINTPMRIAAFLAQLGHESGDFKYMEELASGEAYEGRASLGNNQPGDGKKFKGRGPIQLTGRANYEKFGKAVGQDFTSSLEAAKRVASPEWGFKAAAWFWNMKDLNRWADVGDFQAVTYKINGGCNGADDRDKRYAAARRALGIEGGPIVRAPCATRVAQMKSAPKRTGNA